MSGCSSSGQPNNGQRQEPRQAIFFRSKCVRLSGGIAGSRRIWSRKIRSLSRLSASSLFFLPGFFLIQSPLQNPQDRLIAGTPRRAFAANDIAEVGYQQPGSVELDGRGPASQPIE